jgi:hypothetical protein
MPALPPLINGRSYGWADIVCSPAGIPLAGITKISYGEKQDMQNVYGAGNRPVARGHGRIEYEGSLTLSMEELEKLQAKSPTGRIQDIPMFPVIVSFLPDGAPIVTHKLQYCQFKNNGRSPSEGDVKLEQDIELVVGNIEWR